MSSVVMGQVVLQEIEPAAHRLVLLSLADQSNDDGFAWPAPNSLELRTGLTSNQVKIALGALEQRKAIAVAKRSTTGDVYRITLSAALPARKAKTQVDVPNGAEPIVAAYHKHMVKLPRVAKLTDKRKRQLAAAWKYKPDAEWWDAFFEVCAGVPFLNGDGPYTNGHEGWKPSIDYLLREQVIVKTIEEAKLKKARGET